MWTLDNAAGAATVSNRLGSAAPAVALAGTFAVNQADPAKVTETIGTLTATGGGTFGEAAVVLNSTAAPTSGTGIVVTAAALARTNNSVVNFGSAARATQTNAGITNGLSGLGQTAGKGSAQLLLTTAPTLVGGGGAAGTSAISIIPYAVGGPSTGSTGSDLVTYDAVRGVRPLDFLSVAAGNEYATTIAAAADTSDNVLFNNATVNTAFSNAAVNALVLRGTTSLAGATGTLTLKSGVLVVGTSAATTTPAGLTFNFNGGEAVITTNQATTVAGGLTNYTQLTKAGSNTLAPANPLLAAPVTVNGGTINYATAATVAPATQVTVNGNAVGSAGLNYTGAADATVGTPVVTTGGLARLAAATNSVAYTGLISGDGGLFVNSTGTGAVATLANPANTYKGQTVIGVGRLNVASDNALGDPTAAGAVVLGSATTLGITGNFASSRVIHPLGASTNPATAGTVDVAAGAAATFNGPVVVNAFTKTGPGSLTLAAASTSGGTYTVSAGALYAGNGSAGSATGVAQIAVASGGTFGGAGSVAGNGATANGLTLAANSTLAPGAPNTAAGVAPGTLGVQDDTVVPANATFAVRVTGASPAAVSTGGSSFGAGPTSVRRQQRPARHRPDPGRPAAGQRDRQPVPRHGHQVRLRPDRRRPRPVAAVQLPDRPRRQLERHADQRHDRDRVGRRRDRGRSGHPGPVQPQRDGRRPGRRRVGGVLQPDPGARAGHRPGRRRGRPAGRTGGPAAGVGPPAASACPAPGVRPMPTRRQVLAAGAALAAAPAAADFKPGGRVKHSVVWWCFNGFGDKWDAPTMGRAAADLGIRSVELVEPDHWPILKAHGLTCAIAGNGYAKTGFMYGLNNPAHSQDVVAATTKRIGECAAAGVPSVIAFTGFKHRDPADPRSGDITPEAGAAECVARLKDLAAVAEKANVTVCVEHLNSRHTRHPMAGHPGYQGDDLDYLCGILRRVGSPRVKLLFDIYHVQIMHGDLVTRLDQCRDLIGHVHTAGVPGRHELDATQEINYPAVIKKLLGVGYAGYVGHEFIPTRDAKAGLAEAVRACDG